ncbi:hypothetical protein RND71_030280 [Anisodus tanguticus]|uniref:Uncharacterized protein n=1 Tax=Anisodus tanguticus TaxID=243964 RepID=A0AAE1RHF0_9SOLA|nr:hypothetical protein RND71_030280 [Anisodus tanguticus]
MAMYFKVGLVAVAFLREFYEVRVFKVLSSKRPCEDFSSETPRKKQARVLRIQLNSDDDEVGNEEKVYYFRVLLPNGITLELQVPGPVPSEMPVQDFVILVRREYNNLERTKSTKPKRQINWTSKNLHFVDTFENKITHMFDFKNFNPNKSHMLRLRNMWDLTPDTDLLKELPEEYTFETALADLIDNSLQAVWSNNANQRRLISLELTESKITIFDTGPGMDGSYENSIVKWGKMGASLNRLSRDAGRGGKPPYLTTDGNVRDPLEDELRESTDGSFTKCDEVSSTGRTMMPVEFQVNGINLAEIEGGEVGTTNLLSCNGPEFVMQLTFHAKDSDGLEVGSGNICIFCHGKHLPSIFLKSCYQSAFYSPRSNFSGKKSSLEAHARLRCVYFPVVQGKESIEGILEKLEADGYGITENFESFSHISVRRLGRLLPDARWSWLPFMEPKLRKSDRAEVLKRCCFRYSPVNEYTITLSLFQASQSNILFAETDAGFNPTPSKTDLAHHHPYTIALRNFGNKPLEKDNDVHLEISKDGKKLSLLQLEKQYQDWMFQMHDRYDEEVDCGEDQPTIVIDPSHKKELGISSEDVFPSFNQYYLKTCVYHVIYGPLNVPAESGCRLTFDKGCASFEIRDSKSLPISVIDAGKCLSVDNTEWESQILKHKEKHTPSSIDILDAEQCQDLGIEGALPQDVVDAGHEPPDEIIAVVRPASFSSVTGSKSLDQKYIMNEKIEMTLEVKLKADENEKELDHIYSGQLIPSSLKGFHVIPGPLQRVLLRPVDFGKKLVPGMIIKELALETFDKYGNHMRKDEHIKLMLEGLHLLDKGDSFSKVDDHGCVNLSGTLKVTAGYGKPVSLSVFSGDEIIFKKEFQTDSRLLRVASKVPKVCAAGSHLEDVVFEVINSAGEVDEDVDGEEEDGHSHTLLIRQDSLRGEDNVRYSFRRGRCTVRSIPLPNDEGPYCFVASHSRFHELQTSIEVHVEKAVKSTHEITQPSSPNKEILLLEDSYYLKGPGTAYDNTYDGSILPFKDSRASVDLEDRLQNLGDDICRYGICISQCEANVERLNFKQSNIVLEMSILGGHIGLDSFHDLGNDKDMVVERIEGKADSAAAVVHRLLRSPITEKLHLEHAHDILGVVALLGEVRTHKLSSMLSTYLGEDQMLAVVCKSRAAARALENYQMDGNVNCASALDIFAAKLGISINGLYLVICLEDIRPFTQGVSSDPQRGLALPQPILSNGETPPGFLGYAVNMIFLPAEHLHFRTASGHGLRETLFYRLLGKLQVYKSREHLYMASSCIEDGAVSLDGGMMRGNGVVFAGSKEPYILFPVKCLESLLPLSSEKVHILKRIEDKKLELSQTQDQIQEQIRSSAKYKKKLDKKLKSKMQIEESGPSPGMYNSDMHISLS